MYAFCNTHDVTWGTKGDDKPAKLPAAIVKPDGQLDLELPTDDADLNTQYENELKLLTVKAPKEERKLTPAEKQEDFYKGFRSAVVLAWIFCNFALSATVLSAAGVDRIAVPDGDKRATIYMGVILWSVAGLSLFRFMGAMWFLFIRMVRFFILYHERRDVKRRCLGGKFLCLP